MDEIILDESIGGDWEVGGGRSNISRWGDRKSSPVQFDLPKEY